VLRKAELSCEADLGGGIARLVLSQPLSGRSGVEESSSNSRNRHWKGSPACLRNCPQLLRCRLRGSGITESLLHRKVSLRIAERGPNSHQRLRSGAGYMRPLLERRNESTWNPDAVSTLIWARKCRREQIGVKTPSSN